jgi:hypothetical protein
LFPPDLISWDNADRLIPGPENPLFVTVPTGLLEALWPSLRGSETSGDHGHDSSRCGAVDGRWAATFPRQAYSFRFHHAQPRRGRGTYREMATEAQPSSPKSSIAPRGESDSAASNLSDRLASWTAKSSPGSIRGERHRRKRAIWVLTLERCECPQPITR